MKEALSKRQPWAALFFLGIALMEILPGGWHYIGTAAFAFGAAAFLFPPFRGRP